MTLLKSIRKGVILFFTVSVLSSCVEPFDAEVSSKELDILIIDGYINIGPGETRIVLSKVSTLNNGDAIQYEEEAEVYIQNETGEAYLLNETDEGIYTSGELNLPENNRYRLYIRLSDGKEYHSTLQAPKITPAIDSIHWEYKPDLLYIYANAHDATNESRYYRWSYQEDWQIKTPFKSELKYDKNENPPIFERPDPEMLDMHNCWKKIKSNGLIFGSTAVLTNDVIKFPVVAIPHGSERISVKYSIIVNQHTITQAEFNYLTLMNKNSTQTGSFFDPMPSQLFGNIKRMDDPDETVIGYVGVYTTVQATLFILEDELPPSDVSQLACETITFLNTFDNRETYLGGARPPYVPFQLFEQDGNPMIVAMPTKGCMDCRSDTTGPRPDYW